MENISKTNQKGAMFGLDARIALAIFVALSFVAGAVLFKAVKHSKAVATKAQFTEITNAIEQYYIDTGHFPVIVGDEN